MEEETIETRPQPKVALLQLGEYYRLNHAISVARGWTLGSDTERYASMNPQAAKVNITYDEEGNETGYDVRFVMPLSAEVQETNADILAGIELSDRFDPVDSDTQEVIAEGLSTIEVDWLLNHYAAVGVKADGLVLWIGYEAHSEISDAAIAQMNESGITIITTQ